MSDEFAGPDLPVPDPKGWRRSFGALSVPGFRWLWSANMLTAIGFWLSTVALQWQVARTEGADPFALGLLYFVNLIPMLVFSPVVGVLLDRVDRFRVIEISTAAAAVFAALGALILAVWPGIHYGYLLGLGFVLGSVLGIQGPSVQSIVSATVPANLLNSAVSLVSISYNIARTVGPAIAAALLVASGPAASMAAYAAAALAASVLLRLAERPRVQAAASAGPPFARQFVEGLRHVVRRPPAALCLVMVAVTSVLGASYTALLPVLSAVAYGGGPSTFALLLVCTGVGALAGAVGTGQRSGASSTQWISVRMLGLGLAVVGIAESRSAWVAGALCVVAGMLNLTVMTSLNVILQRVTDDGMRGRVMSLFVLAWGGLLPIGGLTLGAFGRLVTPPVALALAGTALAASAGTIYLNQRPRTSEAEA